MEQHARPAKPLQTRRRASVKALVGLAAATLATPGRAQADWPAKKPIRLVIPSGAGGGADPFSRMLADFMGKELGTQVVVENRPGANGILAAEQVIHQPPDGHTLLISFTAATVGNKLMRLKMSHDPLTDLTPIAIIGGTSGNLLIAHPALPIHNLRDLIAYSKTRNDLSYGSWGIASGGHLFMEYIKQQTGLRANHVPYKSATQVVPDVVSGVLPVGWTDSSSPIAAIKSGRVRAIATSSPTELPQTPGVKPLPEQGVRFDARSWYGLYGPRGMPETLVNRLNTLVNRWTDLEETTRFMAERQNAPKGLLLSPREFGELMKRDLVAWAELIKAAGVEPS
jgi:tripartite-type tricarboxylate transporter receptor subunit TctC